MALRLIRKKAAPKPAPEPSVAPVPEKSPPSLGRRLLPAVLFMGFFMAMVAFFYDSSPQKPSAPIAAVTNADDDIKNQYEEIKMRFARLRQDDSSDEEDFLEIAEEFYAIYNENKTWPNRPAALWRSAHALEIAGDQELSKAHYEQAIDRYKRVSIEFWKSVLADDALLQASVVLAAKLNKPKEAQYLLTTVRNLYPKGDMIGQVKALEEKLQRQFALEAKAAQKRKEKQEKSENSAAALTKPPVSDVFKSKPTKKEAAQPPVTPPVAPNKNQEKAPSEKKSEVATPKPVAPKPVVPEKKVAKAVIIEKIAITPARKKWLMPPLATTKKSDANSKTTTQSMQARALPFTILGGANAQAFVLAPASPQALQSPRAHPLTAPKTSIDLPEIAHTIDTQKLVAHVYSGPKPIAFTPLHSPDFTKETLAYSMPPIFVLAQKTKKTTPLAVLKRVNLPMPQQAHAAPAQTIIKPTDKDGSLGTVNIALNGLPQATKTLEVKSKELKPSASSYNGAVDKVAHIDEPAPKPVVPTVPIIPSVTKQTIMPPKSVAEKKQAPKAQASLEKPKKKNAEQATKKTDKPEPKKATPDVKKAELPSKKAEPLPSAGTLDQRMRQAQTDDMAAQLGLTVRTVYIDIGHGGKDQGTAHNGIIEKDLVLDIGKKLGAFLVKKGFTVIYSRTNNVFIPLSTRPDHANAAGADLFVSVHVNAFPGDTIQGFETYYLDFAKNSQASRVATLENSVSDRKLGDLQNVLAKMLLNVRTDESKNLAHFIQNSAVTEAQKSGYDTKDGGTRSAPFHVLIGTSMPAVLVEVGYCTNKQEAEMLKRDAYRNILAQGIGMGIIRYNKEIEKKSKAHFALTK